MGLPGFKFVTEQRVVPFTGPEETQRSPSVRKDAGVSSVHMECAVSEGVQLDNELGS